MTGLKSFLCAISLALLPVPSLAEIGKVVSVKQRATVSRGGSAQVLRDGMIVQSGDVISTDSSGIVQLVFVDETKIAIGPNAKMALNVSMLRGNRKARSFAVQALGGSFRFVSGKSRKRAYSVTTPTATMAVRGTVFDVWVAPSTQSAMVVLRGRVQMCAGRGACRSTGRTCSMFATTRDARVGRPADRQQFERALDLGFPFVRSQADLLPDLRVDVEGCARTALLIPYEKPDAVEPRQERVERAAVRSASETPPAADPPAPEPDRPEPTPPDTARPDPPAPDPDPPAAEPEPPAAEPDPPAPEQSCKPNRSGQGDGTNPGRQSRNARGQDNPGKGRGRNNGRNRAGKGKRDR